MFLISFFGISMLVWQGKKRDNQVIQELLTWAASHCLQLHSFSLEKHWTETEGLKCGTTTLPLTVHFVCTVPHDSDYIFLSLSNRMWVIERIKGIYAPLNTRKVLTSEETCSSPLLSASCFLVRGRHFEIAMPYLPEDTHLLYVNTLFH